MTRLVDTSKAVILNAMQSPHRVDCHERYQLNVANEKDQIRTQFSAMYEYCERMAHVDPAIADQATILCDYITDAAIAIGV